MRRKPPRARASRVPSAAAAIRPRCCTRRCARRAPLRHSRSSRCTCTTACSAERRRLARALRARSARAGRARGLPVALALHAPGRRAGAGARASRPGRGARATARWREMARAARRRPRPAGAPPPRPGRDLPAAGAARRRRRRPRRRCRRSSERDGITWARPWLDAAARGDRGLCAAPPPALDRRRQQRRHRASPATACARRSGRRWSARFADAEATLADAARAAPQDAAAVRRRGRRARSRPRSATASGLDLAAWRALAAARRRASACVRWLRARLGEAPCRRRLVERLMDELLALRRRSALAGGGPASCAAIAAGCWQPRGAVCIAREQAEPGGRPEPCRAATRSPPGAARFASTASRPAASPVATAARARAARARAPASASRPGPSRPPRSLKLQFQARGVPRLAQRDGPLVCSDGDAGLRAGPRHRRARLRRGRARRRSALDLAAGLSGRAPLAAARGRWLESLSPRASRAGLLQPHRRAPLPMALIVHKYGGTSMGSTERIRNVATPRRQMGRAGHQHGRRALGDERRDQPPARPRQGAVARARRPPTLLRELDMIASTGEQVSVGLLAIALQAEGLARRQLRRLAGADRDRRRLHQGAHREHRRRARARRPRRRQGRHHHRLPGHRRRRPHHHARPRRLGHLGGGGRGGAEGRRVPDLHRRRRRLHHRPAHRRRGAPPARRSASRKCSRWRASAPRCCRSARSSSPASTACRCACCRASRRGTSTSTRKPRSGTLITFEEDVKMEQAVVSGIAFNRDEAKIT